MGIGLVPHRRSTHVARVQVQILDPGTVQGQKDDGPVVDLATPLGRHLPQLGTAARQHLDTVLRHRVAPRDVQFSQVL